LLASGKAFYPQFLYAKLAPKNTAEAERMLRAKSHLRKRVHVSGNEYYYIHIPSKLAHDSQFPFNEGDELLISVDVNSSKMIIQKLNSGGGRRARRRRS